MKKTVAKILLVFFAVVLMIASLAWNHWLAGINIRARNVERIERLWHWHEGSLLIGEKIYSERHERHFTIQTTYTDNAEIRQLVRFFNSLTLLRTPPQPPTASRMPEIFRIIYTNGTESYIAFAWTQVHYNDTFFWIIDRDHGDRSSERLDNLIHRLTQ